MKVSPSTTRSTLAATASGGAAGQVARSAGLVASWGACSGRQPTSRTATIATNASSPIPATRGAGRAGARSGRAGRRGSFVAIMRGA
jgi:hypothetical protein